jgi:Flp pilus assembly pilin Flp
MIERYAAFLRCFGRAEHGATTIEYALISVFIALMLVAVMPTLAAALSGLFTAIGNAIP